VTVCAGARRRCETADSTACRAHSAVDPTTLGGGWKPQAMGGPVYVAMSPHGRAAYPNLLLVPRAPAAGRGRLQRQVRRAFMVYGPELPASTIYEWCKSWPQTLDGRHLGRAHRWSIVRILETVADRVARSGGHGRPWIWRLRNSQLHADATQPIDIAEDK
jgi:hypothetical protein